MTRAALAILLLLAAPARADDLCADSTGDPVPLGLRAGGFDAPRSACLRGDFDARVTAHALVDTPDFYGTLGGDLAIGVRLVEGAHFEWGAGFQLLDVTFAQTAVVTQTETSYGPLTLHAATGAPVSDRVRATALVRAELPFTRAVSDTSAAGAQLAGLVAYRAHPFVTVHGRAALLGWYAASPGGTTTRGAALVSADAGVRALAWLEAFAGLELQGGWHRDGVDHLAARAGVHWRIRGPWRVDVGALAPLAGAERTDLVFTLGVRRDR